MTERTPIQQAAKHLHDELCLCADLAGKLKYEPGVGYKADSIQIDIERIADKVAELMHEDDCDE